MCRGYSTTCAGATRRRVPGLLDSIDDVCRGYSTAWTACAGATFQRVPGLLFSVCRGYLTTCLTTCAGATFFNLDGNFRCHLAISIHMRRMKYHPHGSVLFVTFSVEEGLLLLANPLCLAIVKSCLASAQGRYPITICHFIVEATHVHLVCVVQNPDDVAGFVRYFKTESAHLLNRVLGRRKRTIWCEGYDSPIVLTPIRALIAISYLYSNPAKDNLERSIDDYPGLSSWNMFREGINTSNWAHLRRTTLRTLPKDCHTLRGYTNEAARVHACTPQVMPFTIEPNAWLEAFKISNSAEMERFNDAIFNRVRTLEKRAEELRKRTGKSVIGKHRLLNQRIDLNYRPSRHGKRMWCLSENRKLRITFVRFLRGLFDKARAIRKRWFLGDFTEVFPPGIYPPSLPKLMEPLSAW